MTTGVWLLLICLLAAVLRFTGLAWGAPFFHFHIDEHYVFAGADTLRRSVHAAVTTPKFFMYGTLPMFTLDAVRWVYERVFAPLVLTRNPDEIRYMVMGRAISATFGTACVPLTYLVASRIGGRLAGLLAAFLAACGVVQLRESHFFSVDTMMLGFATLSWWFAMRIAERGALRDYLFAGACAGAAIACKYTALFLLLPIAVAHLAAPGRPARLVDLRGWARWVLRGVSPLWAGAALFAVSDPLILKYWNLARPDIDYWVVQVNNGAWKPIFMAQFADIRPQLYWFTNILWWGLGPGFEIAGLAGVAWLIWRRDRRSLVGAAFPIAYYAGVAQGIGPFMRYGAPFAVGLAVPAGVLMADWLARPKLRTPALVLAVAVCASTGLYAAAYMNVFRSPDARLTASAWIASNIPEGARILVEPSHNIPPMGSYLTGNVDFDANYVLFGGAAKHDYYELSSLDVYNYLYKLRNEAERRAYIQRQLAGADWIVMDDTFLQFYQHLPASEYGGMKQYYEELFSGKLGFQLVKTFKVYPSLFGHAINDDGAELTFRLFDHPRVFVFMRTSRQARHRDGPIGCPCG